MKKKLTIPLLLLVLLIWGWIFYKVIHATDDALPLPIVETKAVKKAMVYTAADSVVNYQPKGGYRDPFLADELVMAEEPVEVLQTVENVESPPEEVYIDWSVIKYLGEVSNASATKKVVLLGINEKDIMLKEGQTQEGITLLQNAASYIKIRYQEKENTILKEVMSVE